MPINIQEKIIPIGAFIRVRPKSQQQHQSHEIVKITQNRVVQINPNPLSKTVIQFDKAFSETATQKQFFQPFQDPIRKMIEGYNLTILAYGQTGSGKSHTMFGKDWEHYETLGIKNNQDKNDPLSNIKFDQNNAGLIPRAIQQLFQQVNQASSMASASKITIYCSFLQIYNEKVFDLFQVFFGLKKNSQKAKPLEIHQSNIDGTFVEGLSQFNVTNDIDCLKLIKFGRENIHIRQTAMNAKSSRSHTIFQISLESSHDDKQNSIFKKSKLTLCDLAGSQKIIKGEKIKGQHLQELKNINKSLSTLGKVMTSLSSKSKQIFAPFRESKLTRLLQQSLTGNTNTFIIGNISPSELQLQQTMNTLRFVEKARHIVMKVKPVQFDGQNREIVNQLQKQIISLKQFLKLKNKGINPQKIQQKLVDLQEQNQKLRKNNISSRDYQKVIAENQRMREEIHKLKLVSHIKTDNDTSSRKIQKNQTKSEESDQSNQRNGDNPFPRKLTEVRKIIKEVNNKFRSKSQMKEQKNLSKSHLPQIQPSKRTRQAYQPSKIQNKSHLYQPKTNHKERYSSLPRQLNQNEEKEQIFHQQNNKQSTILQFLAKNKQTSQFLSLEVEDFQNYNLNQQKPKILGNLRNRRKYIRQQRKTQQQQPSYNGLQSQREKKSKIKEKQKILQKLSKLQVVQKMNQQKLFKDLEKIDGKSSIIRINYHQKNDQNKSDQSRISTQRKSNKSKQRKGHILIRKNDNINFQERIRQLESKLRAK